MNLKQIVLGLGVMGAGIGGAYITWNYMPNENEQQNLTKALVTLGVGATSIFGARAAAKGYMAPRPPTNPPNNSPARNNVPNNSPLFPRTREDEIEEVYDATTGRLIGRRARKYRQNP